MLEGTYAIDKAAGLFNCFHTIGITLQSITVAIDYYQTGRVLHPENSIISIEAKHVHATVQMPISGLLQAAVFEHRVPESINIGIVDNKDRNQPFAVVTNGLIAFQNSLFSPFIVSYFEKFRQEIESRHAAGRHTWPDAWQLAWGIRNATSHDGRVFDRPRQPITWRGLHFASTDEPAKKLLELVNGGDLLILLLDMEETRIGATLRMH